MADEKMMRPNPDGTGAGTGDKKEEVTFGTIVPEEFKDRAYLKDLLTRKLDPEAYKELFKKLDGAEKLVGTKSGIPKEDAPAEEWTQFFGKLRPQDAEAYEFKTKEGETPDPEFVKSVKGMFHKAGLSKAQAKILQEDFSALMEKQTEAQKKEMERLDAEFEALTAKAFGADNEKALAKAQEMLKTLTPDALRPHVEKLSNEAMVILSGILYAVHNKYIAEDRINTPPAGDVKGETELREEAKRLMASPEFKNEFHAKHAETRARVEAIYKKVAEMHKK